MTTMGEAGVIQAVSIVTSLRDAGSSRVGRGDDIDIGIAVGNGSGDDAMASLIGPMVEVGDAIRGVWSERENGGGVWERAVDRRCRRPS